MWASTYPSQTGTALSCTPSCSRAMCRSGVVISYGGLAGGAALHGMLHSHLVRNLWSRRSDLIQQVADKCEVSFADILPCKQSSVHGVAHLPLARPWQLADMEPLSAWVKGCNEVPWCDLCASLTNA